MTSDWASGGSRSVCTADDVVRCSSRGGVEGVNVAAASAGGGTGAGASVIASGSGLAGALDEEVESRTTLLSPGSIGCALDVPMHGTSLEKNHRQPDFLRGGCSKEATVAVFGEELEGCFSDVAALDPTRSSSSDAPGSREADWAAEARVASVPPGAALFSIVFSSSAVVTLGGDFSSRGPLGASVDMGGTRGVQLE